MDHHLILVSDVFLIESQSVLPCIGNTDHNTVQCVLSINTISKQNFKRVRKSVWCLSEGDFDKAASRIDDFDWNTILEMNDINTVWEAFKSNFLGIMTNCVPQKTILTRPSVPWLNVALVKRIRKRNYYYRRSQHLNSEYYWRRYKSLRNKLVVDLKAAKSAYLKSICQSPETNSTWKFIKTLSKVSTCIPTLTLDGRLCPSDREKADALNVHFSRCFNYDVPPLLPMHINVDCDNNFICTPEQIATIIMSWNSKTSCGLDSIPITLLKPVASFISVPLATLFNKSITSCVIPAEWKIASIVPIPKNKNYTNVDNYRPISLLSITSKVLEKFVSNLIVDHLQSNNPLSNSQWGFRECRSTCTALLDVTHSWLSALNRGEEAIIIFFDFRKAFDSIPHALLLDRLRDIGLHNHIVVAISLIENNKSQ